MWTILPSVWLSNVVSGINAAVRHNAPPQVHCKDSNVLMFKNDRIN